MTGVPEPVLLSDLKPEEPTSRVVFVPGSDDKAWAQPLRIAFAAAFISDDWSWLKNTSVMVRTVWDSQFAEKLQATDPEKHRLYSEYMLGVIAQEFPWLEFLLKATGATLYVSPGLCSYQLPAEATLREIPPLLHHAEFLPWRQEAEVTQ